jgi:hypothetical protein
MTLNSHCCCDCRWKIAAIIWFDRVCMAAFELCCSPWRLADANYRRIYMGLHSILGPSFIRNLIWPNCGEQKESYSTSSHQWPISPSRLAPVLAVTNNNDLFFPFTHPCFISFSKRHQLCYVYSKCCMRYTRSGYKYSCWSGQSILIHRMVVRLRFIQFGAVLAQRVIIFNGEGNLLA